MAICGPIRGENEDDSPDRTEQRSNCEGVYCENTPHVKNLSVFVGEENWICERRRDEDKCTFIFISYSKSVYLVVNNILILSFQSRKRL